MKILQIADIHRGPSVFGYIYNQAIDLFFHKTAAIVKKVDLAVYPGDMFTSSNPKKEDIRSLIDNVSYMSNVADTSILTPGNHDIPSFNIHHNIVAVLSGMAPLFKPNSLLIPQYNEGELVSYVDYELEGKLIRGFGYIPKGYYDEKLLAPLLRDCDIALLHGTVEDTQLVKDRKIPKQSVMYSKDFLNDNAPRTGKILMGDIHKPQSLLFGRTEVYYCGSPIPLNFGESGYEHGFYVHWDDIKTGKFLSKFIPVKILDVVNFEIQEKVRDVQEFKDICTKFNQDYNKQDYEFAVCRVRFVADYAVISKIVNDSVLAEVMDKFNYAKSEPSPWLTNQKTVTNTFSPHQMDITQNLKQYLIAKSIANPDLLNRHKELLGSI